MAALGDDFHLVADGDIEAHPPAIDFHDLDLGRHLHARRRRGPVIDVDMNAQAAFAFVQMGS